MLRDLDLTKYPHVYLAVGMTDMRQGINSLASIVQYQFRLNPLEEGSIFLFCGRKKDRIKALLHDSDGYILLYKRLFSGRYQWPMTEEDVRLLTEEDFRQLMSGLSIESTIHDGLPKRAV